MPDRSAASGFYNFCVCLRIFLCALVAKKCIYIPAACRTKLPILNAGSLSVKVIR